VRLTLGIPASVAVSCAVCLFVAQSSAGAQPHTASHSGIILSVAPVPTVRHRSTAIPQVSWSTGDGSPGVVTVSPEGGPAILFVSGPEGVAPAPWIEVGSTYVFRLYSIVSGRRLLARLKVGRSTGFDVVAVPQKPKITSHTVDRVLQLLSFGSVLLLALLAVMCVREVRHDG
jgi:hypothetical protein